MLLGWGGGGGERQGAMGSRSLETTVGEVLLSNAWVKITVVVPLCLQYDEGHNNTLWYVAIKQLTFAP